MPELWPLLVGPGLLLALALAAASGSAALEARAAGSPVRVTAPLAEMGGLLIQQRRSTPSADSLLWRVGGASVVVAAILAVLVIPLGRYPISDLSIGVVWFNAMEVVLWACLWLTGWGANSVFGLVGGYRYVVQGLAYELPHMFALITAALGAESLRVGDIVEAQSGLWFVVWMPAAFVIYLISALAMSFWGPFDQPVGRDLSGGVALELSGVDRLVFLGGRYLLLTVSAAAPARCCRTGCGSWPRPQPSWAFWSGSVVGYPRYGWTASPRSAGWC
jgi:NADH-quinone oxidoreductase subunit H